MNKVSNIVQLVLSKVLLYYHCCYKGLSSLALLHPANPQKTWKKKKYASILQLLHKCCAVLCCNEIWMAHCVWIKLSVFALGC